MALTPKFDENKKKAIDSHNKEQSDKDKRKQAEVQGRKDLHITSKGTIDPFKSIYSDTELVRNDIEEIKLTTKTTKPKLEPDKINSLIDFVAPIEGEELLHFQSQIIDLETFLKSEDYLKYKKDDLTEGQAALSNHVEINKYWDNVYEHIIPKNKQIKYLGLTCSCCGRMFIDRIANREIPYEFYASFSLMNANRTFTGNIPLSNICKECSIKIFQYYKILHGDEIKAMEHWCATTNTYWDYATFTIAKENHNRRVNNSKSSASSEVIGTYIWTLNTNKITKEFWDSPMLQSLINEEGHNSINSGKETTGASSAIPNLVSKYVKESLEDEEEKLLSENETLTPEVLAHIEKKIYERLVLEQGSSKIFENTGIQLRQEDLKARQRVIRLLREDPFAHESEGETKNTLYRRLDALIEPEIEEDFMKLRAAVEIISCYHSIDKYAAIQRQMTESGEVVDPKEVGKIESVKKTLYDTIRGLSKDNGFDVSGAGRKNRGAGTLTGAMNSMTQAMYEPALVNFYDIETTQAMQDVANMTVEAIFKQLNLGDSELFEVTQKQLAKIRELTAKVERTEEELRLANIRHKEYILQRKAKADTGGY